MSLNQQAVGDATSRNVATTHDTNLHHMHENRGIRLSFLRDFVAGLALGKDPTCNEVYRYLKTSMTEQKMSFVQYVRKIDSTAVADPQIFVSHPWTTNMSSLLESLEQVHPEGSNVIVFMDIFCRTYIYYIRDYGFAAPNFINDVRNLISRIKFTVIFTPCWDEPAGLQRLWCVFEIMTTLLYKGDIVLLLPVKEEHKLISDVTADPMCFLRFLVQIDSKNATCTVLEDVKIIQDHILSSQVSFEMINAKVFRMYLEKYQKAIIATSRPDCSAPIGLASLDNNNKKKKKSAPLGIKLSYLVKFIEQHGGEAAFQGKNIHQVNTEYNLVDTAHTKLSHCALLLQGSAEDRSYVGESQWFVSYCWTYKFLEFVESLQLFFDKRGESDEVFLYIDVFSVNQHEGNKPFAYFENEFGLSVGAIGRTLLVTHATDDDCHIWSPEVMHRCWCVFELWATVSTNCELYITMDSKNRATFDYLYRSTDEFIRHLASLKLTDAKAKKDDDKSNIENVIKNTIGYEAVHRQVFTALVEVFVKEILLITPEDQVEFEQRESRALNDVTHRVFNMHKPKY